MTQAIAFEFNRQAGRRVSYSIAYQSCDDSTAQAGKWDSGKASANATAYAQDSSVVGVIGTFNSGAAEIEIPILNRAPNGPLGMVSPANTYVGLTHKGPGTAAGEPGKYYPTGKRNYARVVAADDYQGAADATLAKQLGLKKVFILNDKEAYGQGVATHFKNAATKLGIKVVRLHRVGRQGVLLRGSRSQDQGVGRTGRVPRRPDLRERRQADQGHPGGRPETSRSCPGRVHPGLR